MAAVPGPKRFILITSTVVLISRSIYIVYVAAVGHAFAPNEERGVFMTTDGGRTWTKTLYLDNQHGCSDLEIDLYRLCGRGRTRLCAQRRTRRLYDNGWRPYLDQNALS